MCAWFLISYFSFYFMLDHIWPHWAMGGCLLVIQLVLRRDQIKTAIEKKWKIKL